MSERTPSTPPAFHQSSFMSPKTTGKHAFTPKTPHGGISLDSMLLPTPQSHHSSKSNINMSANIPTRQSKVLQLRTPEQTPRKRNDAIDNEGSKFHHVLFPTATNTFGTGRKLSNNSFESNEALTMATHKTLLNLRSCYKIQIEEEESDEEEEEEKEEEAKENDFNEREKQLMNYSSSDSEQEERDPKIRKVSKNLSLGLSIAQVPTTPTNEIEDFFIPQTPIKNNHPSILEPCTPPNQIMDDDYIKGMNNETCEDPDNLEDVELDLNNAIHLENLTNPFINSSSTEQKKLQFSPRFKNEVEMVYRPTGEKFWIPQDALGKEIKPRRLFKLQTPPTPVNIVLPQTATFTQVVRTPRINMNKDLLEEITESTSEDSVEDVEDGILRVKSVNPFKSRKLTAPISKGLDDLKNVEYINQTTGDKKFVNLGSDEEIKPKRLDFTGC
ncbi:hypothetical protein DAMA08_035660 [Martiniozyma asiatica (nom. inval.)]|nr:hypothetical protein DAMA08_035660 [Martiniozyma asiatica]